MHTVMQACLRPGDVHGDLHENETPPRVREQDLEKVLRRMPAFHLQTSRPGRLSFSAAALWGNLPENVPPARSAALYPLPTPTSCLLWGNPVTAWPPAHSFL